MGHPDSLMATTIAQWCSGDSTEAYSPDFLSSVSNDAGLMDVKPIRSRPPFLYKFSLDLHALSNGNARVSVLPMPVRAIHHLASLSSNAALFESHVLMPCQAPSMLETFFSISLRTIARHLEVEYPRPFSQSIWARLHSFSPIAKHSSQQEHRSSAFGS
jgi:hypothetical protein